MTRMVKMSECELFKLLNRGDALNKAYATVRLVDSVMSALRGQRSISEIVLSRTCLVPDVDYFSLPVILGPKGISHRFPIPALTERENIMLEHAIKFIQIDKQKAVDFLCKRATSQRRTPERTKEYCDLLDCDKKGIFVGALLDRLRVRKESCKPKLEYLLMCKNNDLVYPPDSEPSVSPKRIKFVEPDPVSKDGCSPLKLPSPPSPPKRGLTVIEPKRSKCKIVSSPCPYPPVVKLPKTCNICEKGTPCEHYEDCKYLYGDSKCCGKALSPPGNQSGLTSKTEQHEASTKHSPAQFACMPVDRNSLSAGVNDQLVVSQQANSFLQASDKLQRSPVPQSNSCELPQSSTMDRSVSLTTPNNGNVKSIEMSPSNALVDNNSSSTVSSAHCPYGMQVLDTKTVPEQNSEQIISQFTQPLTNGSANESDGMPPSKHVAPIQDDSNKLTKLQSYSVPIKSPEHKHSKAASNHEMMNQNNGTSFSPGSRNIPSRLSYSNECHGIIPSNINQSINQCLSVKCGIQLGEALAPPPIENNLRIAVNELNDVNAMGVSELKTAEQSDIYAKGPAQTLEQSDIYTKAPSQALLSSPQVQTNSGNTNKSATKLAVADSNTTPPLIPSKQQCQNTVMPVQDASRVTQNKVCENGNNYFVGSLIQAPTSSSSETFNYSGGLGIPSKPMKRVSNSPLLSFNSWSAHREEQYYNEHPSANTKLKNKSRKEDKVSTAAEVTRSPNEKRNLEVPKPLSENMEHHNRTPLENEPSNDYSKISGENGGTGTNVIKCKPDVSTDPVKSKGATLYEKEMEIMDSLNRKTVPIPCSAENRIESTKNKIVKEEFAEDLGINNLVSNLRVRENIRASIEKVKRKHRNKTIAEKPKILGFGQIINTLIPSTRLSKRSEEKSNKRAKLSRTFPRKLYVETYSHLQSSDPKGRKGSVMMFPTATPNDNIDETMNRAKNDFSDSRDCEETSKIAKIKFRVQEALKYIIYPPKYSQKPADRVAKAEKHVERMLQEKLKWASKAVNENLREVRKFESTYPSVRQKLYAPKCPSRLLFGNHPDSRVITFNNVREYDVPNAKTDNGEHIPCSDDDDQTVKSIHGKGKESLDEPPNVLEERMPSNYYLPSESPNGEKFDVTDSGHYKCTMNAHSDDNDSDYWTHRPHKYAHQAPPPASNPEYIQNHSAPIRLKPKTALPPINNEYLKHIIAQKALREKRNEANIDYLELAIKERSKRVMTPGSIRLARADDPKYGLTSPNRTSNQ